MNHFVEHHQYFEKIALGYPRKFYHRVVVLDLNGVRVSYLRRAPSVAPSSGHEWLNLNLPLKMILRRFEVVF